MGVISIVGVVVIVGGISIAQDNKRVVFLSLCDRRTLLKVYLEKPDPKASGFLLSGV